MRTALIVSLLLVLSACGIGGPGGGPNTNPFYDPAATGFYQGYDGVVMNFNQFPPTLFFYADDIGGKSNEIPFGIEVHNVGGSNTRGGIFISGYDPNMIQIEGHEIGKSYANACSLRIADYSLSQLGAVFSCGRDFSARVGGGGGGGLLKTFTARGIPGSQYFSADSTIGQALEQVTFNYDNVGDGMHEFDFDFGNSDVFSLDYYNRGLKLMMFLAGISFEFYNGEEYMLPGNTYDYPGGGIEYIPYTGYIMRWPEGADAVPQTFMATNCYMYTTYASPVVCIDANPYVESNKVCIPRVHEWRNGQGAPIAITQVIQEQTPRRAVFHIEIQNVGGGTVFDPGQLEKCSPYYPGGARSSDLNIVWNPEVRIGDQPLFCQPQPYVRLQNGVGRFTCTYDLEYVDINSAYETPMVVELWYGYSQTIQNRVLVKRVT